jgi:hypothetical protein
MSDEQIGYVIDVVNTYIGGNGGRKYYESSET